MSRTSSSLAVVFILVILGLVGCNLAGESGPMSLEEAIQAGVQATLTKEAWFVGVEEARKTAIAAEIGTSEAGQEVVKEDALSVLVKKQFFQTV